jgi:hypothetical protein
VSEGTSRWVEGLAHVGQHGSQPISNQLLLLLRGLLLLLQRLLVQLRLGCLLL